jgi:hypothetical protein
MGYRSQVTLVAAFKNKEQMDEVLAIYTMNEHVQKHNLMEDWQDRMVGDHPVLYFEAGDSKWYEGYEDVQGYEALGEIMADFFELRAFPYLWYKARIGEETPDVEEVFDVEDDEDTDLAEIIYDYVEMVREVVVRLPESQ